MKSLTRFRTGIVTLAVLGIVAPQTTWAKGPGGMSGSSASHVSSSVAGHVATSTTTNKSNTPSNTGPAPKYNSMSGVTANQLSTKVVGKVDTSSSSLVGPVPHAIPKTNPLLKLNDTGARVDNGINNVTTGALK